MRRNAHWDSPKEGTDLLPRHYKRQDVREDISGHVTTKRNLLLRVVDEIGAPLYQTPPARTTRDAHDGVNETLSVTGAHPHVCDDGRPPRLSQSFRGRHSYSPGLCVELTVEVFAVQ